MGFEKDIESLKIALTETEFRIKKLEEHKEIINKLLRDNKTEESWINETRIRLVQNIKNLQLRITIPFQISYYFSFSRMYFAASIIARYPSTGT